MIHKIIFFCFVTTLCIAGCSSWNIEPKPIIVLSTTPQPSPSFPQQSLNLSKTADWAKFQATSSIIKTGVAGVAKRTPTSTPTLISTGTPVLVSPTSNSAYPNSETPISDRQIRTTCPIWLSNLSKNGNPSGTLILENERRNIFFDLKNSLNNEPAREQFGGGFETSPDGKRYALFTGKPLQIVVKSIDDRIITSIPMEENWIPLFRWINNNQLLFPFRNGVYPNLRYPLPFVVVNIDSGEKQILSAYEYPNIDNTQNMIDWDSMGTTVYDPSLTKVVYLGFGLQGKEMGYIIWDISNKKKIAEIPNGHFSDIPVWSPDGTKVFLPDQNLNYLIINIKGEITKLFDFENLLGINQEGEVIKYLYSNSYRWSPDNRRIALWVITDDDRYNSLLVLDTETKTLTDLCISQNDDIRKYNNGRYDRIIWSPDGKSIAVNANFNISSKTWEVVLYNIEQGTAQLVRSGHYSIVGWLPK